MANFFKKLFGAAEPRIATVMPQNASFPVSSSQTLLEAALANGVDFPHNCTVGTCGTCRCKLIEGKVGQITDFGYTLSREELAAGYILACQASLKGPVTVEIEAASANLPVPEQFSGKITAQEQLTHDIVSVTVQLDRPMNYVAGQYASLALPDGAPRSYSFAAAPMDSGRSELNFYIRNIPGGAFSPKAFSGELQNVPLAVDGPHGHFYLRNGEGPMICIAGGSGLAPLLSLLHDARRRRVTRPCVMLFGARTEKDLYALDQIEEIRSSWRGDFTFVPVLSDDAADSGWTGRRGFVTDILPEYVQPSTVGAEAYMCGPPPMIDAAVAKLTALGVDLGAIHYDKFTDARYDAA